MVIMNETTMYERIYRFFHMNIVKSEYHICVSRFRYWVMKHDPDMSDLVNMINRNGHRILQRIDLNDRDEITYMLGVTLNAPGVKCYLVYSNGKKRRIKLCRFT